jgi:uncharacterized membrane protein required for colicin V production
LYIQLAPIDIAVLLLSFLGGISIAFAFRSKIARFFLSIIIVAIITISLVRGYSNGLESITLNLSYYIAENPLGTIGFVVGFVVGLLVRNK